MALTLRMNRTWSNMANTLDYNITAKQLKATAIRAKRWLKGPQHLKWPNRLSPHRTHIELGGVGWIKPL